MTHHLAWSPWEVPGMEHLELTLGPDGGRADGTVLRLLDDGPIHLRYTVTWDRQWRTRSLAAELDGPHPRSLCIEGDGKGRWVDAEGRPLEEIEGAIDVDIAATPFTNTLPIRRLGLPEGASAEIRVAYINVPALRVTPARQQYTHLGRRGEVTVYRYRSLTTGFEADLPVDALGLVVDYPGVWRRIWPRASSSGPGP